MDINNMRELEKLLQKYLYYECLNSPTLEYLQGGPPKFTDEHLKYVDNLNIKTKATYDCLKVVRESLKFFDEDEE